MISVAIMNFLRLVFCVQVSIMRSCQSVIHADPVYAYIELKD